MFEEENGDLQPTDEGRGYILVAVVYQGHLTLKIDNVVLQTLPNFYLDREKVVDVPLKFSSRSKLVVIRVGYLISL